MQNNSGVTISPGVAVPVVIGGVVLFFTGGIVPVLLTGGAVVGARALMKRAGL